MLDADLDEILDDLIHISALEANLCKFRRFHLITEVRGLSSELYTNKHYFMASLANSYDRTWTQSQKGVNRPKNGRTLMNGASASLAMRRATSVLPTPVGPIMRIFLGIISLRRGSGTCFRLQRLPKFATLFGCSVYEG